MVWKRIARFDSVTPAGRQSGGGEVEFHGLIPLGELGWSKFILSLPGRKTSWTLDFAVLIMDAVYTRPVWNLSWVCAAKQKDGSRAWTAFLAQNQATWVFFLPSVWGGRRGGHEEARASVEKSDCTASQKLLMQDLRAFLPPSPPFFLIVQLPADGFFLQLFSVWVLKWVQNPEALKLFYLGSDLTPVVDRKWGRN